MNVKSYYRGELSLYYYSEKMFLSNYEFDILKRVVRCRFKGVMLDDLLKSAALIDILQSEYVSNLEKFKELTTFRQLNKVAVFTILDELSDNLELNMFERDILEKLIALDYFNLDLEDLRGSINIYIKSLDEK